jgi:ribosomal-protein-alanine N-acetyltransferase
MKFAELPVSTHEMVAIRPMRATDIEPWFAYLSQPVVFEHTSWDVHFSDELADYVWGPESFTDASRLRFAVADRATDELVGTVGFHTVSPLNKTAEMAYDLSPTSWGRGIATSVCQLLLEWAHKEVGLIRVQATVLESNVRSVQVLQKSEFRREGLLRAYRMVRGTPRDFWLYAHVHSSKY